MQRSREPQQRKKIEVLAAGAAILICLFGHLGAVGLLGPDEPRYAWIARAMAQTGDWVTPRLYGEPWFEKPILYYWAAAVGFLLHLPAEWAARLPSACAALAAAITIAWLGRKHYGSQASGPGNDVGWLAALLFAGSVAGVGFARAASPDMLFAACLALAMASAATTLRRGGQLRPAAAAEPTLPARSTPQNAELILFGCFLGLGTLAKGPAAVLLAAGSLGFWALATRQWRAVFRLAQPPAIAAFCLVAIPWYALCALRNRDFLRVFIYKHNFERYTTPLFQHPQPIWFFLPITLLAILPWAALLYPAAREGRRIWRDGSWKESSGFFFACWAAFPILFFSLSQSKLPGYVLPAIPPLMLILAAALVRARNTGADAPLGTLVAATWVVLGIAAIAWRSRMPVAMRMDAGASISACGIIAIVGGAWIAFSAIIRKKISVACSLVVIVLLVEVAGLRVLPAMDPYLSARWHAEFVRNDAHPDRIFIYRVPRAWNYGLAFYAGRELPEWSPAHPESALVLTTPAGMAEMKKVGRVSGAIEEPYKGILYVPAFPAPF